MWKLWYALFGNKNKKEVNRKITLKDAQDNYQRNYQNTLKGSSLGGGYRSMNNTNPSNDLLNPLSPFNLLQSSVDNAPTSGFDGYGGGSSGGGGSSHDYGSSHDSHSYDSGSSSYDSGSSSSDSSSCDSSSSSSD